MRTAAIIFVIAIGLLGCHAGQTPQVILHTTSGTAEFTVEVAASKLQRQRGLMERSELEKNEGMLFIFPALSRSPFWMKNTPLSLDIIFIGEDLRVAEIAAATVPYSLELIQPQRTYRYVLEVRGGTAAAISLKPGDRVTLPDSVVH